MMLIFGIMFIHPITFKPVKMEGLREQCCELKQCVAVQILMDSTVGVSTGTLASISLHESISDFLSSFYSSRLRVVKLAYPSTQVMSTWTGFTSSSLKNHNTRFLF